MVIIDDKSEKLLFSWQNLESGFNLAREGYKVVLCPAEHIYFDMAQSRNYADRGANWAACRYLLKILLIGKLFLKMSQNLRQILRVFKDIFGVKLFLRIVIWSLCFAQELLDLAESAWSSAASKRNGSELSTLVLNSFRDLFNHIGWELLSESKF